MKLLIVDDEAGLCEYLKKFFKPRGYDCFSATTGEEALSLVKRESPELVLLDINMPGMGGLEVLRQIKSASPQTKVIMVTVSDDPDTRQKANILGADEYIRKPFTTDYLEDAVIRKVNELTQAKAVAKILIVDDEENLRSTLKEFISQRFHCEIKEAANGQEALDALKKEAFDLVLLDIKMPGISGMEIIKEKTKLKIKPSIWVITRFDSDDVAHKVIEQGADDYIPKPFSLRVLNSKLRNFLARIGKYKPKGSVDSE